VLEQFLTQTESQSSAFERERRHAKIPTLSVFLQNNALCPAAFEQSIHQQQTPVLKAISGKPLSNKRIGVLFSGGPAAGGHNVVAGLFDVLGPKNTLLGIKKGPKGLIQGDVFEITKDKVDAVRNLGGFDLLGSDRTKIKTPEQYQHVSDTVKKYRLDGIVVIGGDDSNTNAALLADHLKPQGCTVVGVPKTIDGDLQWGSALPISFGFDTATRIYAELVGNILQDTPSSRKYWHVVKLMGRSASHVTLEVALSTKPHVVLISEEIRDQLMTDIIQTIAEAVVYRAKKGMHYGVLVFPEGLIDYVPELKKMISELNAMPVAQAEAFSKESLALFNSLPKDIQRQLLYERDSHGNIQFSQIPTEDWLIELTHSYLKEHHQDIPFSTIKHFFGYEGRCGAPTLFDAAYTYNLGLCAGSLVLGGHTGHLASITAFDEGGIALGLPLQALIHHEIRQGKSEPVIKKALVDIQSPAFLYFKSRRKEWMEKDVFSSPGPRQFTQPFLPITVALNQGYKTLDNVWK